MGFLLRSHHLAMEQVPWALRLLPRAPRCKIPFVSSPWNNWYHCIGSTYGTWLHGDPRGFRTRHHREHIPYDYRHPPPPGLYTQRYNLSKQLMPRPPVHLTPHQRRLALQEMIKSFTRQRIEIIALSVDRIHFHLLARFPDHNPRHHIGVAKKESSHYLKETGQSPIGGIWGTRTQCVPIKDRAHQLTVYRLHPRSWQERRSHLVLQS